MADISPLRMQGLLIKRACKLNGVNVVAGVDVTLHNNIGVVVGAKYSFANLIGKNYEADTRTKYNLNDDSYTLNDISHPSRNITFLQFYGGISFYFGR